MEEDARAAAQSRGGPLGDLVVGHNVEGSGIGRVDRSEASGRVTHGQQLLSSRLAIGHVPCARRHRDVATVSESAATGGERRAVPIMLCVCDRDNHSPGDTCCGAKRARAASLAACVGGICQCIASCVLVYYWNLLLVFNA